MDKEITIVKLLGVEDDEIINFEKIRWDSQNLSGTTEIFTQFDFEIGEIISVKRESRNRKETAFLLLCLCLANG